jgi:hypothetical protein
MIVSIAAAVVASIVAPVGLAGVGDRHDDVRDERDAHIARFGGHVSGFVLAIACVNVLILAITEVAHFWIANAIYASLVLADVTGSITKIVGYRRGF